MGLRVTVTSLKEIDFREQHGLLLKSSPGIMPDACVIFGCSRTANPQRGIGLHRIPFFHDPREESIKRRRKWVNFVQQRRAKWEPTKHSKICSLHFKREDFTRMFTLLPKQKIPSSPRLKEDDLGPCIFPSIQATESKPLQSCSTIEISLTNCNNNKLFHTLVLMNHPSPSPTYLCFQQVTCSVRELIVC